MFGQRNIMFVQKNIMVGLKKSLGSFNRMSYFPSTTFQDYLNQALFDWTFLLFKETTWTPQPSDCGQQRTLNSVHGHTAAWLQSNGNLAV